MSVISVITFPLYLLGNRQSSINFWAEPLFPLGCGPTGRFGDAPGIASLRATTSRIRHSAEPIHSFSKQTGSFAFIHRGDPGMGNFDDAMVLQDLDELRRFDASPAASLASHDFVPLLESAFSLTVFARFFLFSDALPHVVLQIWLPHRCRRG